MNVEHIGLYAADSGGLAAWYRDVLELRVVGRIERPGRSPIVFLQGSSGAILEILPTQAVADDRELDRPGFTHLGLPVANLDTEKARLEKQGVEVWGVRSTSNGWTIGYLRDPEGNILELIQR